MRTGRPKAALTLMPEERQTLESWVARRTTAQALALRARIVLACGEAGFDTQVAQRLRFYRGTVGKWRVRFLERRADGCLTSRGQTLRARSAMRLASAWSH